MGKRVAARLTKKRAHHLRERFLSLQRQAIAGPDPIDFVHRYSNPNDQEVAAIIASSLAFGRVASFWSVLDRIFDQADVRGGPAVWADHFDDQDAQRIEPIFYRWTRGSDLARFVRTIGHVRRQYGSIGQLFEQHHQDLSHSFRSEYGQLCMHNHKSI